MKTENSSLENRNKINKDKTGKKAKTIQTKPYHSNSFKQRGYLSGNINKYNVPSLSNIKKDENNSSSALNSQKKNSNQSNKYVSTKQNKLSINKKLNIIQETNENQNTIDNRSKNSRKINQRNNNKVIIDKNKSYVVEEKKKGNNGKLKKSSIVIQTKNVKSSTDNSLQPTQSRLKYIRSTQ